MSKGMGGKRPGRSLDRKPNFYQQLNNPQLVTRSSRKQRRRDAKLAKKEGK